MGGLGFGQGYFGQYANGGTTPVVFSFAEAELTSLDILVGTRELDLLVTGDRALDVAAGVRTIEPF
jgi:hypothetical protein